ncbi:N-acetyltransferase [Pseudomonas fragi]|nr:GNAT family N-acetyltransferase [Pseudomonas fragi]MDE4516282.1 N-acetyltransferase [Pseudomonas fragi]PAA09168.1 N-acetyltransferase [Pseudomonas fragi]PAA29889.1 N-acetyltransferase [Pseudomonas fragi]PRW96722.1 N-acetyltransferase [Pseudomonas fragi]
MSKVGVTVQDPRGAMMSEALTIHHDQAGHQFETTVDGHRAYLTYMDLGKQTLDIYRTFVPNALRGRGIAAALTEQALDYADKMGYEVIPSCSYVERYMERHKRPQANT